MENSQLNISWTVTNTNICQRGMFLGILSTFENVCLKFLRQKLQNFIKFAFFLVFLKVEKMFLEFAPKSPEDADMI